MVLYYILVLQNNPIISEVWSQHIANDPPPLLALIAGLGLALLIALPGLFRALRRFDPDGDRFMLLWLGWMLVLAYLPTHARASFLVGAMLPLIYFATRAIEDVWFTYIPRRWWIRGLAALVPVIFASNLLVLVLPLLPITGDEPDDTAGILLQEDYVEAFNWLDSRITFKEVVLAAPHTSLWVPAWTGATVVYGHPSLTITPDVKESAVRNWYAIAEPEACDNDLLRGEFAFDSASYQVNVVIYGPQEAELGPAVCRFGLRPLAQFGDVRLYVVDPAVLRQE
jgi:hypothetical protein